MLQLPQIAKEVDGSCAIYDTLEMARVPGRKCYSPIWEYLNTTPLKIKTLIGDCSMHWNSTLDMIKLLETKGELLLLSDAGGLR